jgi:hypothetical protein
MYLHKHLSSTHNHNKTLAKRHNWWIEVYAQDAEFNLDELDNTDELV